MEEWKWNQSGGILPGCPWLPAPEILVSLWLFRHGFPDVLSLPKGNPQKEGKGKFLGAAGTDAFIPCGKKEDENLFRRQEAAVRHCPVCGEKPFPYLLVMMGNRLGFLPWKKWTGRIFMPCGNV